ncbi:hypothetical protein PPTG_01916 [Phytophthora nicotianae INRA-310]|uniref:RxLR effector protein n=2 Tax=Phytophthora nicotianae TaxID=4792 RepID=W2R8V3_PHYN3|nr:hypothetical protein PPTG_01912 [Phytophthora nicotianae INRA-310]XP_008893555.1 hypothetical protein PPTG_01916 [Phytophthora nicotianae INRA-310]KUF80501.1 hypothetical protein AM587_10017150 [Phytophthora nicotianae]ETN21823.1 hypothetical protein PPTG_01912 [Phytophthora nicotianae INRA-310]ETN21829.1 hypothetical protein PPTG_01916 [Phytophthora nicotianae INRA-310]KUF96303.1 Tubulin glycylase 3A [Phytophthora nicotianae]
MRLSQVLLVIAAAMLAASDALSDSDVASISKGALPSGPSQRLLRTHHAYDTTADTEERAAPLERINSLAKKFDIDLKRAKEPGYMASINADVLERYQAALSKLHKKFKTKKAPLYSEDHF